MPAPDRLARALIDVAFELHRRRLWLEVPGDAPFLLIVPGETAPLVATIIGQGGADYGLFLARGERAFAETVRGLTERRERSDPLEHSYILSLTLDPLGEIAPELRGILTAAGFQARREHLAPLALAKPPHCRARNPNRSETRLLLASVRAVLAAHDAGEFRPGPLDERKRRILELEVVGEGRAAVVRTRVVPWPAAAGPAEAAACAALGDIDPALPRLPERWLATTLIAPVAIAGDERNMAVFLVLEAASRRMLLAEIAPSGDLAALGGALAGLFRGEGRDGRKGLPRAITFASEELQRAFAPDLQALGVESTFDPEPAGLGEALQDLGAHLGRIERLSRGAEHAGGERPETLSEWKEADRQLTERLLQAALESGPVSPRALARFFGSRELAMDVLDEFADLQPMAGFMEWLITDYRATSRSVTHLERKLRARRTSPLERQLIEARQAAQLSIYRVDALVPGATIEVEDILTGERATIQERSLSGCDIEGLFLPLRLSRLAGWTVCLLAGPPLDAFSVAQALDQLESLGVELSPPGLRQAPHLVGRLWQLVLRRRRNPPQLCNTDGEPIEWHTATFRVADPAALARALRSRGDLDHDEAEGSWTWFRPGGPAGFGETTSLGRLELLDDRLVLEVNSLGRLARARSWIDALPGVTYERVGRRELAHEALPLDDRLPPRAVPLAPELREHLMELQAAACRRWLDQPVPALGHRTPRAACNTPAGRRAVARMVRTLPAATYPGGSLPPPRAELLHELGLDVGY